MPEDLLNMNILAKNSLTDRKHFKLTDKHNFERVLLTPAEKLLIVCQTGRYLACRKFALSLEESYRPFALRKAVEEENVWAVSALLDIGEFETELYFKILEKYLQEKGGNLIILDVLGRKATDINTVRALVLACQYKNQYMAFRLLSKATQESVADLEQVKTYFQGIFAHHVSENRSIDEAFAECNADSFLSCFIHVYKLLPLDPETVLQKAIEEGEDGNLWAAEVLVQLQEKWDESFAYDVNVALNYAIEETGNQEMVYVLLQGFTPAALRLEGTVSSACKYGNQYAVYYAMKDAKAVDPTIIVDPYEQTKFLPNKDAVEDFKEFFAKLGYYTTTSDIPLAED